MARQKGYKNIENNSCAEYVSTILDRNKINLFVLHKDKWADGKEQDERILAESLLQRGFTLLIIDGDKMNNADKIIYRPISGGPDKRISWKHERAQDTFEFDGFVNIAYPLAKMPINFVMMHRKDLEETTSSRSLERDDISFASRLHALRKCSGGVINALQEHLESLVTDNSVEDNLGIINDVFNEIISWSKKNSKNICDKAHEIHCTGFSKEDIVSHKENLQLHKRTKILYTLKTSIKNKFSNYTHLEHNIVKDMTAKLDLNEIKKVIEKIELTPSKNNNISGDGFNLVKKETSKILKKRLTTYSKKNDKQYRVKTKKIKRFLNNMELVNYSGAIISKLELTFKQKSEGNIKKKADNYNIFSGKYDIEDKHYNKIGRALKKNIKVYKPPSINKMALNVSNFSGYLKAMCSPSNDSRNILVCKNPISNELKKECQNFMVQGGIVLFRSEDSHDTIWYDDPTVKTGKYSSIDWWDSKFTDDEIEYPFVHVGCEFPKKIAQQLPSKKLARIEALVYFDPEQKYTSEQLLITLYNLEKSSKQTDRNIASNFTAAMKQSLGAVTSLNVVDFVKKNIHDYAVNKFKTIFPKNESETKEIDDLKNSIKKLNDYKKICKREEASCKKIHKDGLLINRDDKAKIDIKVTKMINEIAHIRREIEDYIKGTKTVEEKFFKEKEIVEDHFDDNPDDFPPDLDSDDDLPPNISKLKVLKVVKKELEISPKKFMQVEIKQNKQNENKGEAENNNIKPTKPLTLMQEMANRHKMNAVNNNKISIDEMLKNKSKLNNLKKKIKSISLLRKLQLTEKTLRKLIGDSRHNINKYKMSVRKLICQNDARKTPKYIKSQQMFLQQLTKSRDVLKINRYNIKKAKGYWNKARDHKKANLE
ncbi:MAG: hypothetical protein COB50_04335 [Thiotrichales bacterium]|nr:MAG: hypothetical protein COB50_04335 [Thiotrichales bacterium]